MKIMEIRTEKELANLREAWNGLLATSPSNTIFLTWEWVSAWWTAYGTPGNLQVLLAVDEQNKLCGIAPLRRQMVRKYGQTVPALAFIGDTSADSDYLDFIISSANEKPVMDLFSSYLREELSRGALLLFNEVPAESPTLPYLRALGQERGMLWTESDAPCAAVTLPRDWESYLKQLAPRFRTKVRSVLRSFEGREDIRFSFCEQPDDLKRLLPALFDLHRRRWEKEAKPGVFQWDKKRLFYWTLSPLLLEHGWLSCSSLEWKDRVIACQYGFSYGNRYFHLQEGYEPASEHWNVGIALRAWSIQQFLKRGLSEYDFLGGVGRHKSDWGAHLKSSRRLVLARATVKNVAFSCGQEWAVSLRQSVKRRIPASLLAARDERQERARAAEFHRQQAGEEASTWISPRLRAALASCYFHSPIPDLLPRFRDRYRLQFPPNGKLPNIRLEKRQHPSVRILYFHRVNEEADPFSGAISTALFEQEMRFVARHYRVVSLAEAVQRLSEGGPQESMVVITFDDGYQDNYNEAFPILRRYGLPATIFLTTGCIDSRERPWFDKLSLAVKNTSLESIDLEIDVPRRIWLRSSEQRIQGKNRIIALLRELPDTELRYWSRKVTAQLGESQDPQDAMLTWDQVRLMKNNGIDFGGHTVSHPFVSRLSPDQAVWEISECKKRIEEELQTPVELFAYPNGREGDFDTWNKELLRTAGYKAAVSTLWGMNYPTTDRMALKRGQPWEENPALFAAKLDWYQLADI